MADRHRPLEATLARLEAEVGFFTYVTGAPGTPGWTSLDRAVADPGVIDRWFGDIQSQEGGTPDLAGSFLAAWLAGVLIDPVVAAYLREHRAWPLTLAGLQVHRREGQVWFDGLAVLAPDVRVLPDDPDAGHPDTLVVADTPTLLRSLAAEAVDVLVPLFAAVRARAPFGLRGMWGALADGIGGRAAFGAAERGEDGQFAFTRAMAVVDAIAGAAPLPIVRPTLVPVEWSGGVTYLPRKGTCCLLYKTTDDRDPSGENYCVACPLRDDESQLARWVRWLEDRAAERAVTPPPATG